MPVHVVIVNYYLAARDAAQMGPLYRFLGLSVGVVTEDIAPAARRRLPLQHHLLHQQASGLRLYARPTAARLAQARAERLHARMRADLFKSDEWLGDAIAFAGERE